MGALGAEWSLPVEAWLKPVPEPALRRKDRNVDTIPDISVNRHLICCPSVISCFELKLIHAGSNQLAVFVPLNNIVVSRSLRS